MGLDRVQYHQQQQPHTHTNKQPNKQPNSSFLTRGARAASDLTTGSLCNATKPGKNSGFRTGAGGVCGGRVAADVATDGVCGDTMDTICWLCGAGVATKAVAHVGVTGVDVSPPSSSVKIKNYDLL